MTQHPNLFRNRYPLSGSDWLRRLPAEDRLVFSRLGHMALRQRDIPLQSLGGRTAVARRCGQCGKFQKANQPHVHAPQHDELPF